MKHILSTLVLTLGLVTSSVRSESASPQPGPGHHKLEGFVGSWKFEEVDSESPFGKAGKGSFTSEYRKVIGGLFFQEHGKGVGPDGAYEWINMTSFDSETGNYSSFLFDSTGFASRPAKNEIASGSVSNLTWTWTWKQEAKGKSYFCKSVQTLSQDGRSTNYEFSYSEDGTHWKSWLKGKATKTSKG